MKKIYNLIALAILMIVGTAGARAQKYYVPDPSSGENVTEIEEGVDYAIMSARYADSYLCGNVISSLLNGECLYQFEKAGENADGDMTWRIKRSIDNKWLTDDITYTDMQEEAFVCQIRQPRYYDDVPSEGDENYDDYNADNFVTLSPGGENSWVILEEKERKDYLSLYSGDNAAHIWSFKDTNALRIVKVKEAENAQLVSLALADLCPNGLGGYVAGDGFGQCSQEALDEATAAYAACEKLANTNSNDTEACNAAVNRLKEAMAALEASIKDMTEGYYYMVNLGRTDNNGGACPYNVEANSTALWNYYGDKIPEKPNGESVPYIWQFIQEGNVWYIKNVVTGKYIGTGSGLSTALPMTDTPFGYNINVCTDLVDINDNPITGYFNIQNPTNASWCCHAAVDGQAVVYWNRASGTGNHASAWTFVKVNEDGLDAVINEYKQIRLEANISALIEKTFAAYNCAKSYLSDAAPYDNFTDEPGILQFEQTDPADASTANVTSNATETSEGSIKYLFDGDFTTYFHSMWNATPDPNGYHYLQIDLGAEYQQLVMKYAKRHNNEFGSPTVVTIQGADNVDGPYVDEVTIKTPYSFPVTIAEGNVKEDWGGMAGFEMGAAHRYIRIVVKETSGMGLTSGYPFFYWSELRLYEGQGLDEENSMLTFIDQEDAQVTQTLLEAVSQAEVALDDGTVSQTIYDELQAAYDNFLSVADKVQIPYNNQIAHTRLTAELSDLQAKLDKVKTTIETDCPDVAADFVETEQAIQDNIDASAIWVKEQYEAVALTTGSTISGNLEAKIEKLLADAIAAQYPSINEAAYARLTKELAELQNKLDEAKATVTEDCPDVAADFTETEQAIQDKIDALAANVKEQYEDNALTEKSTLDTEEVEAVETGIEALINEAATAQRKFTNEAIHTRLTNELAALQEKLDEAKATVTEDCPDVAADFEETEQGIQNQIDALAADIEKKYEEIALTEESFDTEPVEERIELLLSEAATAQKAFATNEAVYTKLKEELPALQAKLDDAKATIAESCPDVAADFAETEQDIQEQIDALTAEIEKQYKEVALTEESANATANVEAEIDGLLSEAIAAQKAFAANEAAYTRLTNELAALQAKLEEAKAAVETDSKDVAADFAETEQEIRKRIDAIADKIKEQYENGALTEESTLGSADVEAEIGKLLSDAAEAQKAFTANEEAHTRLTGDLAGLQETLDKAIATVAEDCKDVAGDFAETQQAIQDKIDAIAAEVEKQYEDIALTAESTIDTEGIKAEIEKLLSDAAEAQKAYETITGIHGIEGIASQQVKTYTANGQLVNAVVKGQVNILVFPDGTVKRVYVK